MWGGRFWQTLKIPLAPHPPSAPLLSSNQYTSCFYSCLCGVFVGARRVAVCSEGQTDTHTHAWHSHQHPHVHCCPTPSPPPPPGGQAPRVHIMSAVGRGCGISNTHPLGGAPPSPHSSYPAPPSSWACGPGLGVVASRGAEAREATGRG